MRSRQIRGQILKLYEIAPNFARFLPFEILGVRATQKFVPTFLFKFSLLTNCWGTPIPDVIYVSKPWPF